MRLYDGRAEFYQYDTNQKLICDSCQVGEEIHFSNKYYSMTAVCVTYELDDQVVVNVPNAYLMCSGELIAYRVCKHDGESTVDQYAFTVNARKKPSDYVYEETEVLSYRCLEKRIGHLEKIAEDLFWADVNKTTYQEVIDAVACGKVCVINDVNGFAYLTYVLNDEFVDFTINRYPNMRIVYRLTADNTWTTFECDLLTEIDKTKTITEKSDDIHIPTAKAVYNALQQITIDGGGVSNEEFDALLEKVDKQSEAIADKLDANALSEAINDALAQAKESGEFNGKDGFDYVLTESDKTEIAEQATVEATKNHYTKTETDTALSDKAPKTLIVNNDYGVCTPSANEIIAYRENGGNTILADVDLGYFQFLCQCGRVVFYGGFVNIQDQIGCVIFQVVGNTVTTYHINFSEFVKMSDLETIVGMIAKEFDKYYTKSEIDAIMGSYITDVDALIGGGE